MAFEDGKKARISRVKAVVLTLAIIALAAGLRFYKLNAQSLWNDEITTSVVAKYPFSTIVTSIARADSSPPGCLITYRLLSRLTGTYTSRVFPAIMGVLGVIFVMLIADKLWGKSAALFAGVWLAFNPVSIYVSQEMRYSTFLALFYQATLFNVIKLFEEPRRLWVILLALCVSLVIYTHYYSFIFVALLFIYLTISLSLGVKKLVENATRLSEISEASFFAKNPQVRWLATFFASAVNSIQKNYIKASLYALIGTTLGLLSFAIFLRTFAFQLTKGVPFREPLCTLEFLARSITSVNILHSPNDLPVLSGLLEKFYENSSTHLVILLAISLVLIFPAIYAIFLKKEQARWILTTLSFGTIVLLTILTRKFPAFEPKYLAPFVPFFGLLWALGVSNMKSYFQAFFTTLCIVVGLLSISDYYFDSRYEQQRWDKAAKELINSIGDNEVLAFYHLHESLFLTHYMGFSVPKIFFITPKEGKFLGGTPEEKEKSIEKKLSMMEKYDGAWLLIYHPYVFDKEDKILRGFKEKNFYEVSRKCRMKGLRRFCLAHFVKGFERAVPYFRPQIDFSSDYYLLSQILEGFNEPEKGWAWIGKKGKVFLPQREGKICLKFFANCDFISCPFYVNLYAEKEMVVEVEVKKSDIYEACGYYKAKSNPVIVEIVSSNTFDPSAIYGGPKKELSILISKIGWGEYGTR